MRPLRQDGTLTRAWSPVSAAKPGRSWKTGNTPRKSPPRRSSPASKRPHRSIERSCAPRGSKVHPRPLRYHHQLWNALRPKTLRGVHTTLVYVTPQLGYSLTPHIRLDKAFNYFAALSRWAGPGPLFPDVYIYLDAEL